MILLLIAIPIKHNSYGHGVLRDPDPRFTALQTFYNVRPELQNSPIIQLVKRTSEVAPGVLREHGKVGWSHSFSKT